MNWGWSTVWLVCVCTSLSAGAKWRFPETASSLRIDTKLAFGDRNHDNGDRNNGEVLSDEPTFEPASDTSGFYNRPAGAPGRYPVHVDSHDAYRAPYKVDGQAVYSVNSVHKTPQSHPSDGTLDTLQYCKCVSTPECNPSIDSAKACGSGKFLCCYKRPNKHPQLHSDYFNELEDERPELQPGQTVIKGPFPPPPGAPASNYFGPEHGTGDQPRRQQPAVLVGPGGPTGNIGPPNKNIYHNTNQPNITPNQAVLVGPNGPTGIIGPRPQNHPSKPSRPLDIGQNDPGQRGVLVGPGGPTGIIGPRPQNNGPNEPSGPLNLDQNGSAQRGVLVGPGGPTGIIGPRPQNNRPNEPLDLGHDESAQRGILVGPGGPTGIIGPGYSRRPVLVGPGGPTGIIGPFGYGRNQMGNPGILVGPGGPTGTIGPRRGVLVGPGGPTGQIGPRNPYYFGK